ncbi:hypothetical protein BOQ62_09890 [Chryseobacterium sp. CH21]|nr:hypothetical protein BOQ62_09890 [Chryseobacterium sp. CH21]
MKRFFYNTSLHSKFFLLLATFYFNFFLAQEQSYLSISEGTVIYSEDENFNKQVVENKIIRNNVKITSTKKTRKHLLYIVGKQGKKANKNNDKYAVEKKISKKSMRRL